MKKLILLIIPVALFSCAKEVTDPAATTFQRLVNRYMVCDSILTTVNGVKTVRKLGKGMGEDMRLSQYATFTVFSNPEQEFKFQFQTPNKFYYWKDQFVEDQYYIIAGNTGTKVNFQRSYNDSSIVKFFTVEP